ncbi:TlpA family protein disulfide reductase [Myroides guanonis]|uniref:Thiol-disulfide isomerase or thioredoxin n=1 Tax=Myroides guanonis TaxID=1150112 RepID=A0A1I3N9J9_9FLAO|nr:TlpA disulfide reductase family protein [Myroides guanonis]SFJ05805.1 Thiol-disulfide isomerase or thioredoxin [Myroides guanonis]
MKEEKSKKKGWVSNIIFVAILGVMFFTPLGTELKIWVNRLFAFSPSVEAVSNQESISGAHWFLKNENGEEVLFEDLEGKVILVNFWATWCPPCIAEKPSFQKLYDDYKDKVVFLFVTSESEDKVKAFKLKHGYTLPIYYPVSAPPEAMQSNSIPASFVIDKKGTIVVKKFRAADWNSSSFRTILDSLIEVNP